MPDHYATLGVPPQASTAEIRQAYLRLARERHPDRFTDPEQKRRAGELLKELTEAFNTLCNERARRAYDAERERPARPSPEQRAREAYARGLQELEAGHAAEAVELLRVATAHAPGQAAFHAALGRALAADPQLAREAIEALETSLRLDPRRLEAHRELALLLLRRGLKIRARRAIETGLRIAPGDTQLVGLQAEAADAPAERRLLDRLRRKS